MKWALSKQIFALYGNKQIIKLGSNFRPDKTNGTF